MTRYKGMQCGVMKPNGDPCRNPGHSNMPCWLHRDTLTLPVQDPRLPNVVKAFKCPHCQRLTELVER